MVIDHCPYYNFLSILLKSLSRCGNVKTNMWLQGLILPVSCRTPDLHWQFLGTQTLKTRSDNPPHMATNHRAAHLSIPARLFSRFHSALQPARNLKIPISANLTPPSSVTFKNTLEKKPLQDLNVSNDYIKNLSRILQFRNERLRTGTIAPTTPNRSKKKITSTGVLAIAITSSDVWIGSKSRPTWSIQLSIAIPIYRHIMNRYRNCVDTAREVVASFSKAPLPKDVTSEFFDCPRRLDILIENLMTDKDIEGRIEAEWIQWHAEPNSLKSKEPTSDDPIIFYLHGGAYFMCSAEIHRSITWRLSKYSEGTRVLAINYKLAPEHPFPIPLHDAISAYLHLVDPPPESNLPKYDPKKIILCGDSAGGGLALALTLWLRDHPIYHNLMPGGLTCLAPWLDLTHSLPSWIINEFTDYVPTTAEDPRYIIKGYRSHYYTISDEFNSHPLVSPLFSNENTPATTYKEGVLQTSGPRKLPPTLIHVGEAERLRDESLLFVTQSVPNSQVRLEIWKDQPHVFQVFTFLGEGQSDKSLERIGKFIRYIIGGNDMETDEKQKSGVFMVNSDGTNSSIGADGALKMVSDGWSILNNFKK
ncbi:hypothetical protein HK096_009228 [Nowakowskiella sp. JEL0078]|nr:hypothetical protein HK096_009228 [Nowakowskiella sp. JEL0078]